MAVRWAALVPVRIFMLENVVTLILKKRYEVDKDFQPMYPELDHLRYLRACKIVFDK